MDAWNPDQLKKMQCGGNERMNAFLKRYGVEKHVEARVKYNTRAAGYYRDLIRAEAAGESYSPPAPGSEPESPEIAEALAGGGRGGMAGGLSRGHPSAGAHIGSAIGVGIAPSGASGARLGSVSSSGALAGRGAGGVSASGASNAATAGSWDADWDAAPSSSSRSAGGRSSAFAPVPGVPVAPPSGTSDAMAVKQARDDFFARQQALNAAKPEGIPPSQGGRYVGFGSSPAPAARAGQGAGGEDLAAAFSRGFAGLTQAARERAAIAQAQFRESGAADNLAAARAAAAESAKAGATRGWNFLKSAYATAASKIEATAAANGYQVDLGSKVVAQNVQGAPGAGGYAPASAGGSFGGGPQGYEHPPSDDESETQGGFGLAPPRTASAASHHGLPPSRSASAARGLGAATPGGAQRGSSRSSSRAGAGAGGAASPGGNDWEGDDWGAFEAHPVPPASAGSGRPGSRSRPALGAAKRTGSQGSFGGFVAADEGRAAVKPAAQPAKAAEKDFIGWDDVPDSSAQVRDDANDEWGKW